MKVLLDHDVPHGLRLEFPEGHKVVTAYTRGEPISKTVVSSVHRRQLPVLDP